MSAAAIDSHQRPARLHAAGMRGLGWTGLAQVCGLAIRLCSNLVLTRLLAPDAYAVLGSAMTVLTILEWLSDLGIQPALVRHPRGGESAALLTGWWMGLGRGVALAVAGVLLAWPSALVMAQPPLVAVIACLGARPALLALRSPAFPLLRREMNYRGLFLDEVTQTAAGTAVSLLLAWLTGSAWALVGGTMAGVVAVVALSYVVVPMAPRWAWDREVAKDLGHFGGHVMLNTLVMALVLNLDRILGVRLAGLEAMGCYFVAFNLASAAEALLTRACDVQFAMMARMGDEERHAHEAKVMERLTAVVMPLGCLGVALAPLACRLMYDGRYAATGWLLALMAARLMVRTPGQVRFQALLVEGRIGPSTWAYAAAFVAQVVLLPLLGVPFGAAGVAAAVLLSTLAWTLVQTGLAPAPGGREVAWLARTFACAGLGLAAAWMLG